MHNPRRPRKSFRTPSRSYRSRRKRNNHSSKRLIFFLVIISVCVWGIRTITSRGNSVSAEATIEIRRGIIEFSLNGEDLWTRGNSGQKFLEGDRVRCTGNCEASVQLLDGGSVIVIAPNTEISFDELQQKSSGTKKVSIFVKTGTLWGTVAANDFSEKNSHFLVQTESSEIDVKGTLFNLDVGPESLLRILQGEASLRLANENKKKEEPFLVNEGHMVPLKQVSSNNFDANEIIEKIDPEFEESEWNLKNLELFRPQEAAEIRHRIERTASPSTQDPSKNGLDSPVIQTPAPGAIIPAAQDMLSLEGTAPVDAYRISVNGYILTKFQPGDRKWSYFASKKFGTLVPGKNTFKVVSISRDGKESAPAVLEVTYNATSDPVVVEESESDFPVPVIQFPSLADATQAFNATEPILHITGIVDPRTVAVEVNGFRLKKFKPGNIEWKYIANANYGNMDLGENIYTVVAIGPEDERSSAVLRVNYVPQ